MVSVSSRNTTTDTLAYPGHPLCCMFSLLSLPPPFSPSTISLTFYPSIYLSVPHRYTYLNTPLLRSSAHQPRHGFSRPSPGFGRCASRVPEPLRSSSSTSQRWTITSLLGIIPTNKLCSDLFFCCVIENIHVHVNLWSDSPLTITERNSH